MVHVFCDPEGPAPAGKETTFTFTFRDAWPPRKFCFGRSASTSIVPTNRPLKRRRALSDVDGEILYGRKKRRLRLQFITSRLSRPFSQPASNIVDRGRSKIALWGAKNKAMGRNELRKAAIMNSVRMHMDAAKDSLRREQAPTIERMSLKEIVIQKSRGHEVPLPPSPLGLSNYDAFDLEDDFPEDVHDGDGLERISSIYSDFNIMSPDAGDAKTDDFEYLDALDGITPRYLPDTPLPPSKDGIVEVLRDDVQEQQSYFMSVAE